MKSAAAWLALAHRYLGFALCIPFTVWFASGIAMIYARDMPRLTAEARLQRMAPIDMRRVVVRPADAVARARGADAEAGLRLLTVLDRPAYRAGDVTVFADTGELLPAADARTAVAIASRFMRLPESRLHHAARLTAPDQWTIAERRGLPLHRIDVDDDAGTELYVSERLAEVVVMTTTASRRLAAIGAIPHWIYFRALRVRPDLWRQVVLWLSAVGSLAALIGLVVGVLRIRRRPLSSPYGGALKWHHVAGLIFGIFTLTWVVSGFLSMQPWDWASDTGGVDAAVARELEGAPLEVDRFPPLDAERWARTLPLAKEIVFARIQGSPVYLIRTEDGRRSVVAADTLEARQRPFDDRSIVARVRAALPGVAVASATRLDGFDAYYYSRDPLPLPVLRLVLDDSRRTWLYIDPATSRLIASVSRRARLERWLYHGLHSLDFGSWYYARPAWDIVTIALLAGGLVVSALGAFLTARRAVRVAARRIR